MNLFKALLYYVCVAGVYWLLITNIFAVLRLVGIDYSDCWNVIIGGYFVCGIFLNFAVHKRLVDYHPMHDDVDSVAAAKLSAIFFWPISYPWMLFKFTVTAIL
jgi:hypothetical protein